MARKTVTSAVSLMLTWTLSAAVDMDQTVGKKLQKVKTITEQINDASEEVMVLQDHNWIAGSPETVKATKQLQDLLDTAESTNTQLQMGMATIKGKATAAQMALDQSKASSAAACSAQKQCDVTASKAAGLRMDELKETLQDYEMMNDWKMSSVYNGGLEMAQSIKERHRDFMHNLFKVTAEEMKACRKELGHLPEHMTPCQRALNVTIQAQWNQVMAQQLAESCSLSAEKLTVSIKKAEELLRPLVLGEERLFQRQRLSPDSRWPWMARHGVALLVLSLVAMFTSMSLLAMILRSRLRGTTRALTDEEMLLQ